MVKAFRFDMRRCTLVAPQREEVNSWHIWSLLSLSLHHDLGLSCREPPKDHKLVQLKTNCRPWAPIHLEVCLWHLQGNWLIGGLTTEPHPMSANEPLGNSPQSNPSSGRRYVALHKISYMKHASLVIQRIENGSTNSVERLGILRLGIPTHPHTHECMSQDASICRTHKFDLLATSAQTQNIWEP